MSAALHIDWDEVDDLVQQFNETGEGSCAGSVIHAAVVSFVARCYLASGKDMLKTRQLVAKEISFALEAVENLHVPRPNGMLQ